MAYRNYINESNDNEIRVQLIASGNMGSQMIKSFELSDTEESINFISVILYLFSGDNGIKNVNYIEKLSKYVTLSCDDESVNFEGIVNDGLIEHFDEYLPWNSLGHQAHTLDSLILNDSEGQFTVEQDEDEDELKLALIALIEDASYNWEDDYEITAK